MARMNTHELDARMNFMIYGRVIEEGKWVREVERRKEGGEKGGR